ncbi:hypothetical protein B0H14DRAFT_3857237 [Mycena olivaceomarginata]|nr:hypothetical protein B0H14DRAFT_3857237 [Mycena olivaceomarginata]
MAQLWDELDDEEREECESTAKARNSGTVDEMEKRKLASAHADKEISVFTKKMFDLYGQAQTSVHKTAVSPKFSQQFPNWKTKKGVANAFLEYSEFFADGDSGDEDDEDGPHKIAKYPWAQIDFYRDEEDVDEPLRKYPILPQVPAASKAHEWIGGAKMVIRAFVKAVHELQVGSHIVPWSSMATPEGARALIDSKYLVKNLGLKDPSRMVKSEVEAYYKHWISRQDDGKRKQKRSVMMTAPPGSRL